MNIKNSRRMLPSAMKELQFLPSGSSKPERATRWSA
eukprot:CAMPEP_0115568000 /NCGR_PEP_ID=MMETSP0271-20121206/104422_1 /TAXON_ID=71861 /ORGANISM="Scrippsiella trochoidea, Strain CCMP3099" /LENGTH=35 /DNA_ID= /DNA_START= /DNA_END= /DNA_ORIENTATION=